MYRLYTLLYSFYFCSEPKADLWDTNSLFFNFYYFGDKNTYLSP